MSKTQTNETPTEVIVEEEVSLQEVGEVKADTRGGVIGTIQEPLFGRWGHW